MVEPPRRVDPRTLEVFARAWAERQREPSAGPVELAPGAEERLVERVRAVQRAERWRRLRWVAAWFALPLTVVGVVFTIATADGEPASPAARTPAEEENDDPVPVPDEPFELDRLARDPGSRTFWRPSYESFVEAAQAAVGAGPPPTGDTAAIEAQGLACGKSLAGITRVAQELRALAGSTVAQARDRAFVGLLTKVRAVQAGTFATDPTERVTWRDLDPALRRPGTLFALAALIVDESASLDDRLEGIRAYERIATAVLTLGLDAAERLPATSDQFGGHLDQLVEVFR